MSETRVNLDRQIVRIVAAVFAVTVSMMSTGVVALADEVPAASTGAPDNNGWQ
jgi:hypothetical protein